MMTFRWPLHDFPGSFPGRAGPEGPSGDGGKVDSEPVHGAGRAAGDTVVGDGGVGPIDGGEVLIWQVVEVVG
jgi:hypothetical protein